MREIVSANILKNINLNFASKDHQHNKTEIGISNVTNVALNWAWGTANPTHIWGSQGDASQSYVYNGAQLKTFIGLTNVDNTSDVNKPVSTAQQIAINTKLATGDKATDSWKLNGVSEATASTINTIAKRDSDGDISVRLLRSEYVSQNTISGAMAFRTNNIADNYVRFCSDPAAIRTWLGTAATSHNHTSLTEVTDIGGKGSSGNWGSLNISGIKAGWAGINFTTVGYTFMIDANGQAGVWQSTGACKWYFDSAGNLAVGKVDWTKITNKPTAADIGASPIVHEHGASSVKFLDGSSVQSKFDGGTFNGTKGDTGATGPQGIAGLPGKDGEAGIQGLTGPQGAVAILGPIENRSGSDPASPVNGQLWIRVDL